jgi:hypothetical protein
MHPSSLLDGASIPLDISIIRSRQPDLVLNFAMSMSIYPPLQTQ